MLKRLLVERKALSFLILFASSIPWMGCRSRSTPFLNLKTDEVRWDVYTNPLLHYSVPYPSVLEPESHKGEVLFRYGWGVPVLVRYEDEEEGKKRGAWFGHKAIQTIQLDGRSGQKYIYDHWDGPFAARTISYVVEYRDKYLALEFRTDDTLSEIQERMLASFRFPPD